MKWLAFKQTSEKNLVELLGMGDTFQDIEFYLYALNCDTIKVTKEDAELFLDSFERKVDKDYLLSFQQKF